MLVRNGITYDHLIRNGIIYRKMIRNGITYGSEESALQRITLGAWDAQEASGPLVPAKGDIEIAAVGNPGFDASAFGDVGGRTLDGTNDYFRADNNPVFSIGLESKSIVFWMMAETDQQVYLLHKGSNTSGGNYDFRRNAGDPIGVTQFRLRTAGDTEGVSFTAGMGAGIRKDTATLVDVGYFAEDEIAYIRLYDEAGGWRMGFLPMSGANVSSADFFIGSDGTNVAGRLLGRIGPMIVLPRPLMFGEALYLTTPRTFDDILYRQSVQSSGVVAPPGWFDWELPFVVEKTGRFSAQTDFDPAAYRPDPDQVFYVAPEGDDGDDGLTPGTAKQSLRNLITSLNGSPPAGRTEIRIAEGTYESIPSIGFACSLIGDGEVVIGDFATPAWTPVDDSSVLWRFADGTGNSYSVIDRATLNEFGHFAQLQLVATQQACEDTPGTVFSDSDSVIVHLHDSREPDSDVRVLDGARGYALLQTSARQLFVSGIQFWGGIQFNHAQSGGVAVFDACLFGYHRTSDTARFNTSSPNQFFLYQCRAAYAAMDNFWYGGQARGCEIDCLSTYAGWLDPTPGGSHNASTAHNSTRIVRVGGEYRRARDRSISDVNDCRAWNVACDSGDPTRLAGLNYLESYVWSIANGGLAYFEGCRGLGGGIDLRVADTATAFIKGCDFSFVNVASSATAEEVTT